MFFPLSKVLWFFTSPGNLFFVFLVLATVLLLTRWRRAGMKLLGVLVVAGLIVSVLPFYRWLMAPLEDRFATVENLPGRIDGIVVLGGVVDQFVTRARGQVSLNGSVERLTEMAVLARRYPKARLVFSGGSGRLGRQDIKEADVLGPFLDILGVDPQRIVFERMSRNTYENARFTYDLVKPKQGENWVLITSAFHMPRSVGSFRKAGWTVIPYPVDYNFTGQEKFNLSFNFASGLGGLGRGGHEWMGLLFYWITGKTDAFFPAPSQ